MYSHDAAAAIWIYFSTQNPVRTRSTRQLNVRIGQPSSHKHLHIFLLQIFFIVKTFHENLSDGGNKIVFLCDNFSFLEAKVSRSSLLVELYTVRDRWISQKKVQVIIMRLEGYPDTPFSVSVVMAATRDTVRAGSSKGCLYITCFIAQPSFHASSVLGSIEDKAWIPSLRHFWLCTITTHPGMHQTKKCSNSDIKTSMMGNLLN